MRQLRVTTIDIERATSFHEGEDGVDEQIKRRAELMYDYFDYDNDRTKVRERFLKEAQKKTTLKDIGD